MDEIRFCDTKKGSVEYLLKGEGPTVLFVHGGHGSCLGEFGQQSLIDNGFSVLIPTRPGYRGTPIGSGETVYATADLFAALLDALEIEKVTVVGISAGGPTALVFAGRYPELTEKLILESAVVKPWMHRLTVQYYAARVIFHPKRQEEFWRRLREKLRKDEKKTLVKNLKRFTRLKPDDMLSRLSGEELRTLKEGLVTGNDSGCGFVHDMEHRSGDIRKISCPTLIIHSQNDGCLPISHAEYAHKMIRESQLYHAPTDSHFIYIGPGSREVLEKRLSFLSERSCVYENTGT